MVLDDENDRLFMTFHRDIPPLLCGGHTAWPIWLRDGEFFDGLETRSRVTLSMGYQLLAKLSAPTADEIVLSLLSVPTLYLGMRGSSRITAMLTWHFGWPLCHSSPFHREAWHVIGLDFDRPSSHARLSSAKPTCTWMPQS